MSSVKGAKFKALADLQSFKRALAEQAKAQAEQAAALALQQDQSNSDKDLFIRAAGTVQPLPENCKTWLKKERATLQPGSKSGALSTVLREPLSDAFDPHIPHASETETSYTRPGIGTDVTRKLGQGHWKIQAVIDLHGLRIEAARDTLGQFIRQAQQQGLRCVRVVHGKGLGSAGQTPVLKDRVLSWLAQKNGVLAYVQARPAQGGAGALLVLLATVSP